MKDHVLQIFTWPRLIPLVKLGVVVFAFLIVMLLPTPGSMHRLAAEMTVGREAARDTLAHALFGQDLQQIHNWQSQIVRVMERSARSGFTTRKALLRRNQEALNVAHFPLNAEEYSAYRKFIEELDPEFCDSLLARAAENFTGKWNLNALEPQAEKEVDKTAWQMKVGVALAVFVVLSFILEAMPFPAVAFTIGLVLVFTGVVHREEVAGLFWSDASWFIMGSLMLAAALIKTGLDKRISLGIFKRIPFPNPRGVTAWLILVISLAAMFLSGHVLAAIFLPIGMILYQNSLTKQQSEDPELAKMLMITIAMACNIGGFGAPSGGARNVIIINYLEDMYGYTIGYGQWMIYAVPYVLIMMVILWILVNVAFKPQVRNLQPALTLLQRDINRMGRWTQKQAFTLLIFLAVVVAWITEKTLLRNLLGFSPGIGVIAVTGAMVYLLSGVVTWRDYQEKVDWGIVWLYAGAIIFGRVLDRTGAAHWMADSLIRGIAATGIAGGLGVIGSGSLITALLTNILADGPTAAAVGPVTIKMAALSNTGVNLVPIMGLATACASSFAFLLVIGTPPNAIVFSSGYLRPRDFFRVGLASFIIAFLLLLFFGSVIWPMIGGLL
ncbi:MAG: SLC13 family permease [bacterium]